MAEAVSFTTDVGRLVMGSVYKGQTTAMDGSPLVIKTGPNKGQARTDYFFAVAIPKKPGETHWGQTTWGKMIWETGHRAWPAGQGNSPSFAWKIDDGDSIIPNKKGRKLSDREGCKGCWVLFFGGGYAPRVCNKDGSQYLPDPDVVKLGYYVQVLGSVSGNGSTESPGIYLNHQIVSLQAFGPEIVTGPDAAEAGFGQAPLPAGASSVPVGGMTAGPATPPPGPSVSPPVAAAPPPVVVTPHPGFAQPGAAGTSGAAGTPAVPGAPVSPPPPPVAVLPPKPPRIMLPAAQGATYEACIAEGWTDALLVQHEMMAP